MKEKIREISLMRSIACFLVLFIHTTANATVALEKGSAMSIIFVIINRVTYFAVPLFIFISGWTLLYSYKDREFSYIKFIKKRFKTVGIPYIIFTLIYYCFFIVRGVYAFSPLYLLKMLALGKMVYHLYFVCIIFQFYLLFFAFRYLFKYFNPYLLLGLSLAVNLISLKYLTIPYSDRIFTNYIFFFCLGCFAALNIKKLESLSVGIRALILAISLCLTSFFVYYYYNAAVMGHRIHFVNYNFLWLAFSVFSIAALYILTRTFLLKTTALQNFLNKMDPRTYIIYLAHPLVLMITAVLFNKAGYFNAAGIAVINIVILLSLTFAYTLLYDRLKNIIFKKASIQ
ncbi:MAG: acyltransferase [Bacillota bacterium]|nr:acyltransferase [Bacillota bacterium]